MEKIAKIVERMKERKRATDKAKEDIQEILDWITQQIPDTVDGYNTKKEFKIEFRYWDGNWYRCNEYARFGLRKGEACIKIDEWKIPVVVADLIYINLSDAVEALEEFMDKIANIKTFTEEAEKLQKIRAALGIS